MPEYFWISGLLTEPSHFIWHPANLTSEGVLAQSDMWTAGEPNYLGAFPFCINIYFNPDDDFIGLNDDGCSELKKTVCQKTPLVA